MLDFNALRVFYTVSKCKSITKAAETLYISQTIITNTLKKLQKDLHITLFRKDSRSLSLTEHGEKLFLHTEQLFLAEQRIESFLSTVQTKKVNNLSIGIPTLYNSFDKKKLTSCFKSIEIEISTQVANSRKIISLLDDKAIDIAIASDLINPLSGRYITNFYKKHEVSLIIPKGHRLYGKEYFSPHDINFEKVMLKEKGSALRKSVDDYCKKHNTQLFTVAELESFDSLLSASLFEKCLTFLPDMAIHDMLSNNNSFSISKAKDEEISYDIYLITRNSEDYPLSLWAKMNSCLESLKAS